jgi:hypothetical protein
MRSKLAEPYLDLQYQAFALIRATCFSEYFSVDMGGAADNLVDTGDWTANDDEQGISNLSTDMMLQEI